MHRLSLTHLVTHAFFSCFDTVNPCKFAMCGVLDSGRPFRGELFVPQEWFRLGHGIRY